MKIIEIRALRGPNYYSRHPVIFMKLDLQELEMTPTDLVPDFKDNISSIIATGDFIKGLMPGRKIRMASSSGNRPTYNILEYGVAVSRYYDYVIVCDSDPRQRVIGETAEIVKQGLISGGLKNDMIKVILEEREATKAALEMAGKGDILVLQADNIKQVINDVLEYKAKLQKR